MKILVDTNVILDVLCAREGFVESSSKVWKYCETGLVSGYISALSVPNIVYILRKELDAQKTKEIIKQIGLIFSVADLTADDLKKAAEMSFNDYEDALQVACAKRIQAECIITRNIKDFAGSPIPVKLPSEFFIDIK
ncbi:MAG: PIN domain-containing protein [Ruminiclostridium sp.]|nr:PIN domain-containing protein [Ruminiclostridium sp.]